MDLTPSEMPISKILSQILSDAVTFDGRHSKLIELLIDSLKDLVNSDTPKFCTENGAKVISEIIVDFLLRFKDKHPFSGLIKGKIMNVLNVVLEFVCEYSFKPSAALLKEYAESKFTKELNTLPTRELLNSKFDERFQIYEERYKLLKKRFESRPPFVYYFNPDIEMEVKIGFFEKGTDTQIGAGMYLYNYGNMFQGYFKNDSRHMYGREIWADGDIYEGGLHMGDRHGKGKYEHYENGRVEI